MSARGKVNVNYGQRQSRRYNLISNQTKTYIEEWNMGRLGLIIKEKTMMESSLLTTNRKNPCVRASSKLNGIMEHYGNLINRQQSSITQLMMISFFYYFFISQRWPASIASTCPATTFATATLSKCPAQQV